MMQEKYEGILIKTELFYNFSYNCKKRGNDLCQTL